MTYRQPLKNYDRCIIVLTDDHYLYSGIELSVTNFKCYHVTLSGKDSIISLRGKPLILVDSRIVFSRLWSRFDEIIVNHPHSDILLLPHRYGNNFINDEIIFPQLKNASHSESFRMAIYSFLKKPPPSRVMKQFTHTQKKLSPYFSSGKSVAVISNIFKWPRARSYTHRINLSKRLGLKHASYLSFHLSNLSPYFIYLSAGRCCTASSERLC